MNEPVNTEQLGQMIVRVPPRPRPRATGGLVTQEELERRRRLTEKDDSEYAVYRREMDELREQMKRERQALGSVT